MRDTALVLLALRLPYRVVMLTRTTVMTAVPPVHIPLGRVALCLDCDACFDAEYRQCPACGSRTWSSVSRFIGQKDHVFAEPRPSETQRVLATHGRDHALA